MPRMWPYAPNTMAEKFRYITTGGLAHVGLPLTPAFSLGEREFPRTALVRSSRLRFASRLATLPPLPKGEGWGEGKQGARPETTSGVSKAVCRATSQGPQ